MNADLANDIENLYSKLLEVENAGNKHGIENLKTIISLLEDKTRKKLTNNIASIRTSVENNLKEINEYIERDRTTQSRLYNATGNILGKITELPNIFKNGLGRQEFWKLFDEYCEGSGDYLDCKDFIFPETPEEIKIRLPSKADFTNAVFKCDVIFIAKNGAEPSELNIENCKFKNLIFSNCKIKKINTSNSNVNEYLKLIATHFTNSIEIKRMNVGTSIMIDKCTTENTSNSIEINDVKTPIINILIMNNETIQYFQNINIASSEIKKGVIINCANASYVRIGIMDTNYDLKEKHEITILDGLKLNIHISSMTETDIFIDTEMIETLFISYSKLHGDISVKKAIKDLYLSNCSTTNNLIINSGTIEKLGLTKTIIEKRMEVNSIQNDKSKNNISIRDCTINKDGSLTIYNKNINKYSLPEIDKLENKGLFSLINMVILHGINIKKSTLGNTEFHNIDMKNANIKIENSSLADTKFYSVQWPNIKNINAEQDTFRQLKYVHEKMGDNITAAKFYAGELEEYKKKKVGDEEISLKDKTLLHISGLLSEHGQNWVRPLLLMSILMIAMMQIFTLILNKLYVPLSTNNNLIVLYMIFFAIAVIAPHTRYKNKIKTDHYLSMLLAISIAYLYLMDGAIFNNSINYVNPLIGTFKDINTTNSRGIDEDRKLLFVLWIGYKAFFIMLGYHLVVSLKRITKF